MRHLFKTVLAVLLTLALLCGTVFPAGAWFISQSSVVLFTTDGALWFDYETFEDWTQSSTLGQSVTVYSLDGYCWYTAEGLALYCGITDTTDPSLTVSTLDNGYVSPDDGNIWLYRVGSGFAGWIEWFDYWYAESDYNPDLPYSLYKVPDCGVYSTNPISGIGCEQISTYMLGLVRDQFYATATFQAAATPDSMVLLSPVDMEGTWKTTVTANDFIDSGAYSYGVPSLYLTPVTYNPRTRTFLKGHYDGVNFSFDYTYVGDEILRRTVYLKALRNCTVDLSLTCNTSGPCSAIYCMLESSAYPDPSSTIIRSASGSFDAYYPIAYPSLTATDNNYNGIVDWNDEITRGMLETQPVEVQSQPAHMVLEMTAMTVYPVTFYCWLEGQDANCCGSLYATADCTLNVQRVISAGSDDIQTAYPLSYIENDDEATIVGFDDSYLVQYYDGVAGDRSGIGVYFDPQTKTLTLPQTIAGKTVTKIDDCALYTAGTESGMYDLQVILPNTVEEIGAYAFSACVSRVHVPFNATVDPEMSAVMSMTVCCDAPNSVAQQTNVGNYQFVVCTGHGTSHTHTWGDWTVTTPATTAAEGEETRTCTRCGATETRTIPVITEGYGFFSGGYGTQDSPFLISTAADFDHIDDFYAAYGDDLPCTPVYFTQTANLDLSVPPLPEYTVPDPSVLNNGFDDYSYGYSYYGVTPVSVMHDAVYDGGGYAIFSAIGMTCFVGDDYAGVFGHVTDSTIRNVRVFLEGVTFLSTAANGCAGMIARAENCLLDTIRVRYWGDARAASLTNSVNVGALAGCVQNCCVQNCLAQISAPQALGFIGGAAAGFTSRNTWWVTDDFDRDSPQNSVPNVTGTVFVHEDYCGVTLEINDQQIVIPDFTVLTDAQGNVQPEPLQYDPTATGLQYHLYYADHVTFAAGEHGSLTGAGSAVLYGEPGDAKTVTGLIPIPDTGYVFDSWSISVSGNTHGGDGDRAVAVQTDGSYVYSVALGWYIGTAVVTANFASHETHTFGEWTVTTPATCTATGERTRTCTACGFAETETVPMTAHSYDAVVTEPTCTEGGCTTYTCSRCGETYTADETPALGHVWGEWTVTTPATTEAEGVETRTCTRCSESENRAIPRLIPAGTLTVTGGRAKRGETVDVTVDISDNPGITAAMLRLTYDPQALTLTSVENGTVLPAGGFQQGGDLTAVPFTVFWTDALATENHTADGLLVTFTFEVKADAPIGTTPVTVTYETDSTFNKDMQAVTFAVENDTVEIYLRLAGDSDGDGVLDLKDVAALSRFLAGGWDVTVDTSSADVDGDGKLTLRDVVILRRYLAGWDVVLL